MTDLEFTLNSEGIGKLLKSDEIGEVTAQFGQTILNRCGSGYTMDTRVGKYRNISRITAVSEDAIADNLRNNTLLKALHGGE